MRFGTRGPSSYDHIYADKATWWYMDRPDYLAIGTQGKSAGKWKVGLKVSHTGGGRAGLCKDSFSRATGRLGDAGTADSFGVDNVWVVSPSGTTSSANVWWCFGGVSGTARVDVIPLDKLHEVQWAMAFDALGIVRLVAVLP